MSEQNFELNYRSKSSTSRCVFASTKNWIASKPNRSC